MQKVLVIEEESFTRELLLKVLKQKGVHLFSVDEGIGALGLLKKGPFALIFSSLKGIQTLERLGRVPLQTPLIYVRSQGEEGRKGVAAVLERPLVVSQITTLLAKYLGAQEKRTQIIAESPQMKQILKEVEAIARSHSNVFILGESGTGKEVIAKRVHAQSKRSDAPFVQVNCAALADTLIESEFFGHEKGAYTGAYVRRIGRFERADQGTLLLDEVSEIAPSLQAKLLRVIQEQEFERVGGTEVVHVDVRLISTSNQNIQEGMREKWFREDLYYRLHVLPIFLPPLRERIEDILPLARLFLSSICERNQIPLKRLSKGAQDKLLAYFWPGNIRELCNVIEYAVVVGGSDGVEESDLFFDHSCLSKQHAEIAEIKRLTLKEWEKKLILEALRRHDNHRTYAAKELGITTRTLRNKLKG